MDCPPNHGAAEAADPSGAAGPPTGIALLLREAQLRGIFETASEAILTADEAQTIVMANRAAAEMFQHPVDTLIGRPLADLVPERFRTRHGRHVTDFGRSEITSRRMAGQRAVLARRADGHEFPVEAAISQAHVDGQRLYTVILRDLTEEHRAAAALTRSERLLAATFDASSIPMCQIDPATRRFTAVNAALCALVGYDAAELLAMEPDGLNHPDDRLDPLKFAALLRGTSPYGEQKRLCRKDGSFVWVEVTGSVVRDSGGHAVRVVGTIQDITARRQAEELLRAREARQSFLLALGDRLRQCDDPHAVAGEAGRLLVEFVGAARAGYAEDDGNGGTISALGQSCRGVPPIDKHCNYADFGPALMDAIRAGRTLVRPDIAHEAALSPSEREAFAAMQVAAAVDVPTFNGSNWRGIVFVQCASPRAWTREEVELFEDVAQRIRAEVERTRAEAELRAAKTQLEVAIESMNDAVFITDAAGNFSAFNTAFATFHRFRDKSECPTAPSAWTELLELSTPDGSPAPLDQWAVPRALRGETGSNVEYGLRRRDTGGRWTGSFSFAPIRDAAGRVVGAVVTARDTTEARRVQSELEAAHADLRRLIAVQDEFQQEERLRIAREIHDETLQNLAVMLMDVTAAQAAGAGDGAAMRKTLSRVERLAIETIGSTRRIIEDLRPVVLDELGLVSALRELARGFAERSGVACHVETSALSPADEERLPLALATCLYRVAQEALNNVAKHAGAKAVRIRLGGDTPGRIHLSVDDDGRGLPAVFEGKPRAFGLLGMRERVRAVGGTLHLASRDGGGTSADVDAPLAPAEA